MTSDHGVELGAAADAERLQVRLVGSSDSSEHRDAGRDQETIRCGEFGRSRDLLARDGTEVLIDRVVGVRVQAVKPVPLEGPDADVRDVAAPLRARTLR